MMFLAKLLVMVEEQMYCTPFRRFLAMTIGAGVLLAVYTVFTAGPLTIHGVSGPSSDKKFHPGDQIVVVYDIERAKVCPAEIIRFWIDDVGAARYRSNIPGGYSSVGRNNIPVILTIPEEMAGSTTATYKGYVESYCNTYFGISRSITDIPPLTVNLFVTK